METIEELLKRKKEIEAKIAAIKMRLGHPHLDDMSAHDLAETEFQVWSSCLDDIENQIYLLKKEQRQKNKGR